MESWFVLGVVRKGVGPVCCTASFVQSSSELCDLFHSHGGKSGIGECSAVSRELEQCDRLFLGGFGCWVVRFGGRVGGAWAW